MEDKLIYSKELLESQVKEWARNYVGDKFEFREYQLETIVGILDNILNDKNHTQIIEAPTGSGKSLINIISAGVLDKYYNKQSYILVSDLFLWKQYDDFINVHPNIKRDFGVIKGQTGNYTCLINKEDMRNADCRMAGISWATMFNHTAAANLGYECASKCQYIKERKKALQSNVVLMTYQLYHYMINVVSKVNPKAQNSFKNRDIIFCDECHNIPTIIKNNFQPEIRPNAIEYFNVLYNYTNTLDLFAIIDGDETTVKNQYTWEEINNKFNYVYKTATDEYAALPDDKHAVEVYMDILNSFATMVMKIESDLAHKKQINRASFTKEDVINYKACSWYRNTMCFWNDFFLCLKHTGIEYIVKEIQEDRKNKMKVAVYSNAKEDFLSYYFLLGTAVNRVMLSATIGGYDAFCENVGTTYIENEKRFGENEVIDFKIIPSTFNFDKSPILFLNRFKMSYAYKDESFKKLKPAIYKICEKFKNERGMIQTGSYANAQEIYRDAPLELKQRLLLYGNSKEKSEMITLHQMMQNSILIGPTLVEGIDLPGDQCRFIVIMKVPYPVITDKYVKKKLELFPLWYNSTTSNIIIQGIGRGNRFKDDYCTTYILDACFLGLYNATKEQYPKEVQNRIKIFN